MCINRTFSELNGAIVNNGTFSVRYVMENESPRFVLMDIIKSLGYKAVGVTTSNYCKMFGLGKVVGADNKLRTYATKEQVDLILDKSRYSTPEFREFWNNEVVPATDEKYAGLKREIAEEKMKNERLEKLRDELKEKNESLLAEIKGFLSQRDQISSILGLSA